jgi:hypothetical protein
MPQILTHAIGRKTGPDDTLDRARLTRFAHATGLRDRRRRRAWLSDEELERAICGYAFAVATAEQSSITLDAIDIDAAIRAYRRARRLPPHAGVPGGVASQRALLTLVTPAQG